MNVNSSRASGIAIVQCEHHMIQALVQRIHAYVVLGFKKLFVQKVPDSDQYIVGMINY